MGSELSQQLHINVWDPFSFFDDADKNNSAFRFFESTPGEVGLVIGKFPNKGSPSDKIHTLICKK